MTKTQFFHFVDLNKNGSIDNEELADGLKGAGMPLIFVGKVMSVFDKDGSKEIDLDEWLHILGEDVEMEDVPLPDESFIQPKKD